MQFRWKKRDDGFEWHKYVRTTIKLRREARRDKAEKLGRQAAEGARAAGIAAEALARKGAGGARAAGVAAGDLAKKGARGFGAAAIDTARLSGTFAAHGIRLAGRTLAVVWRRLGAVLAPALDVLARPAVGGSMLIAGLIALAAGIGRMALSPAGLDAQAKLALAVAAACLAAAFGPAVRRGDGALPGRKLQSFARSLSPTARRALGAAAGLAVVALAAFAVVPARFSLPSVASIATGALGGGQTLSGRAYAVAADRLHIAGTTVRLSGIETPDPAQRCPKSGANPSARTVACGEGAREAMRRLLRAETITCDVGTPDANGIASGRCRNHAGDLAEAMVRAGHAFAESGFVATYSSAEAAARTARTGMWAAIEPERPAAWRERMWSEAKQQAPGGCPIKGRIRNGERLYVLPWSPDYGRIRLRATRGERWFCSESEATSAGWKAPGKG